MPADLVAKGFNRHTFLCGQSGSGKTYTLGRVLEQLLLATDLRIAVFDPNSDYTHMASLRPRDETALDEREYGELEQRYGPIAAGIHVFGGPNAPRPLQARFGRLSQQQQTMLLGPDPIRDAEEYSAFVRTVDRIGGDRYGLEDVLLSLRDSFADEDRRLGMRIVNLGVADLPIWASAGDTPMRDALPPDWRMLVFDLGSLASDREQWVASAAALGELWALRTRRQPLLIVIDEAHNVCPREPVSPNQALATEHAVRIAGEGRKFGRYLLLATQQPDKVHANVVSQCDSLLLMRMNSAADIESLKSAFSFVPDTLLDQVSGFRLGEGLAAGKVAPHPLRFVTGRRYTVEGGADIPSTWAEPR